MTESAAHAEPRISYLVARLDRAIRNASSERLARYNVTVPMYTALTVLRARSGLSNAQLARRIFVSPQSMQQVVGALEADGLIKRESDSNHARMLRTTLTKKGIRTLAACDEAIDEIESAMLDKVTLNRADLAAVLQACIDGVRRLAD